MHTSTMSLWSIPREVVTAGRFLSGLHAFLGDPPARVDHRSRLAEAVAGRATAFLSLMRDGVYAHSSSPYRRLLDHAGIEWRDLARLVEQEGLEGALQTIESAGVWLSLDEFKGRQPIRRGSLTLSPAARAFANPLLRRHFAVTTGGSRSSGRAASNDLGMIEHEACYDAVFLRTFGLESRPTALWRAVPPGSAGLKGALRSASIGHRVDRWFSQTPVGRWSDWRHSMLLQGILMVGRISRKPLPRPEHVPPDSAEVVARWLAARVAEGRPGLLDTTAASGVRVCLAARDRGLDLTGTFFRVGGEPLSPGKVDVFHAAGCRVACHYSMAEAGRMGNACADPDVPDEVHVAIDKVALLERAVRLGPGVSVPALCATSLRSSAPHILLNVDLGDYAVRTRRVCGCAWQALGFTEHLHTIRSYEKLTSEGMHFIGTDLIDLVEQTLPGRFGGDATDYQFVEEEHEGMPRVSLVISPRVPVEDTGAVVSAVLDELSSRSAANRMMAGIWRDGHTLRVIRRPPYATSIGKIHSLHVPQPENRP